MDREEHKNSQPLRELQWLAHYLNEHSREDLAQEILRQIKLLRHKAQDSLKKAASDVIDLDTSKRKRSG